MKVNFKKVILTDIEGKEMEADFKNQLGNQLYMQGRNIEECELGKKIYFADDEVELSDKEADIVRRFTMGWALVARTGIEAALKE